MKAFAQLIRKLDESTKTNDKLSALVDYFKEVSQSDGSWAVYFLSGNRLSRCLPPKAIRQWAQESSGIPQWLFEESYSIVGDLAETISLLMPSAETTTRGSLTEWVLRTQQLTSLELPARIELVTQLWNELGATEKFVFAKLITGGLRVGVSRKLLTRALVDCFDLPVDLIAHRLMGDWSCTEKDFQQLTGPAGSSGDLTRPFPFCLAHPLETRADVLGDSQNYQAEWKWDGIRAQVIRRSSQTFIWSRGEERIEDRFPEIGEAAQHLPEGIVLDGEILAWKDSRPLGFLELQKRIQRRRLGKKILSEVPCVFIAFDLLELDGKDYRQQPLVSRRRALEESFAAFPASEPSAIHGISAAHDCTGSPEMPLAIRLSETITFRTWSELDRIRDQSRSRGTEGMMLKSLSSAYHAGRPQGIWWKWKVEPFTIDAVLIYAQRGHGRRANLYTDYTFALWQGDQLVPFAKAYSGLTDAELRQVDRFVRGNTNDKFGPVRSVTPELVMELAFENIQASKRHKSGVAVRFPRIVRWRHDKRPKDANTLEDLRSLAGGSSGS